MSDSQNNRDNAIQNAPLVRTTFSSRAERESLIRQQRCREEFRRLLGPELERKSRGGISWL
jgi:hypothetical protein